MSITYFIVLWICIACEKVLSLTTDTADFKFCKSSFIHVPTIDLLFRVNKNQQICLSRNKYEDCAKDFPHTYDNKKACIAVYFINDFQVPVFSGVHFHGKVEQVNKMPRKKYSNHWRSSARDSSGNIVKLIDGNWRATTYQRGHQVGWKIAQMFDVKLALASNSLYHAAPQLGTINHDFYYKYESPVFDYADKTFFSQIIDGDVLKDFYYLAGSLPNQMNIVNGQRRDNWINMQGPTSSSTRPSDYHRNIPGFFWGATCFKYTFPTIGKSFSLTISYVTENKAGAVSNNPTSIDELKRKIEVLGNQYGSKVKVNNLFGSSDCETTYSCGQIKSMLIQNNPRLRSGEISALIRDLQPDNVPSSFPSC